MNKLTISLPDPLIDYLKTQLSSGSYETLSDYIQALIQQDQQRQTHLESLILEELHSEPATPMISKNWDTVRAAVRQRIVNNQQSNG